MRFGRADFVFYAFSVMRAPSSLAPFRRRAQSSLIFSASTGSICAARVAGTVPKTTPTRVAAARAMKTDNQENGQVVVSEEADGKRHGQSDECAHESAGERNDDRLGKELELDFAIGGAQGLADADFADAGAHVGQHDVHDAHAAHRQGDGGHQHQHRGEGVGDLRGRGEQLP